MLAAADGGGLLHDGLGQAEHWLGTAGAAGLQLGQSLHIALRQQAAGHLAVDLQRGDGGAGGSVGRGQLTDAAAEFGNVLPPDGEARGQLVAAEAFQQRGKLPQCCKQIKAAVGAGGGLAVIAVQTDQKRRAAEFLAQTRSDDADHALMPALSGQHDGAARLLLLQ